MWLRTHGCQMGSFYASFRDLGTDCWGSRSRVGAIAHGLLLQTFALSHRSCAAGGRAEGHVREILSDGLPTGNVSPPDTPAPKPCPSCPGQHSAKMTTGSQEPLDCLKPRMMLGNGSPPPARSCSWGPAQLAASELEGHPHSGGMMGVSKGGPLKNKE